MINYRYIIFSLTFLLSILCTYAQGSGSNKKAKTAEDTVVAGAIFDINIDISTSAVSSVSGKTMYKTPTANITNTLYGLLPGLSVRQGQGEPGYDAANINIRGIGAYTYGAYAIYVDGFQSTLSYAQSLSAAEIQSVAVLKDAAALTVFGLKGANGVLWITTNRGNVGHPTVTVQLRAGIQQLMNVTKPLESYQYASLYNEAYSNDNGMEWTPFYNQKQLDNYQNGRGTNVDWYNKTLNKSTPFYSADVSVAGGSDVARYFVLANYTETNGLYDVKNDDNHSNAQMRQYNIRSNFDFTLFKFIDGKVDFGGSIGDRKRPAFDGATLWSNLERYPRNIYPMQNTDRTWTGTMVYPNNPVASINELGKYTTHDRSMQSNFTLKERLDFIVPGLYLSQAISFSNWTRGSRSITRDYARYMNSVIQTSNKDSNYEVSDDYGTNQWNWQQLQLRAGYDKKIGLHSISSGLQYLHYKHKVDANQNGTAGVNTTYAHVNLAGRINYSYADKYLSEISFAYSGSDNYRPGKRFVFYPAISLGWVISKEKFLSDVNAIDLLKLRLSVGQVGYDTFSGGRYLYQQYYKRGGGFPTGNGTPIWQGTYVPAFVANPDITAEKSSKYNVGIDMELLGGLSLTFDAFMDKRSDIISQDYSLAGVVGEDEYYRNLGKVTTQGLELNVSYRNKIGGLNYSVTLMGTYLKDKIDYMAELPKPSPYAMQTGNSIGSYFGYESLGFYDITDFDPNGNLKGDLPQPSIGAVQPGDIKYRNINDDGVIDERDMVLIGRPSFPNFTYAMSFNVEYKGFDLSVLMQGAAGRDVNLLSGAYNKVVAFENNGNAYQWAQKRWAYYPEKGIDTRSTATYPRLSTKSNDNNYVSSSFWIKNGNFLRVRNIELGYALPEKMLSKMGMSAARIYVSGVNLFTFSKLLDDYDIDPETLSGYPGVKSYNLGVSISF